MHKRRSSVIPGLPLARPAVGAENHRPGNGGGGLILCRMDVRIGMLSRRGFELPFFRHRRNRKRTEIHPIQASVHRLATPLFRILSVQVVQNKHIATSVFKTGSEYAYQTCGYNIQSSVASVQPVPFEAHVIVSFSLYLRGTDVTFEHLTDLTSEHF